MRRVPCWVAAKREVERTAARDTSQSCRWQMETLCFELLMYFCRNAILRVYGMAMNYD
jgi:hypothetical protein